MLPGEGRLAPDGPANFPDCRDTSVRAFEWVRCCTDALRYAVKLKRQLLAYTEDGRLEIDNNPAENALRGICVGRKNWLFAGADCGGERAAAMYSLIETAKLNSVNPQAWLADVLDRIGKGHPINRIDDLLPWNWSASQVYMPDLMPKWPNFLGRNARSRPASRSSGA